MEETAGTRRVLTSEQRRLVEENLGLVKLHLRRNVRKLQQPRRDREWEDLVQEGCLGLIDAAQRYNPDDGIPFASFALSRIHTAVSRGLQRRFATVYIPPRRTSPDQRKISQEGVTKRRRDPEVLPLTPELAVGLLARPEPMTDEQEAETIGQRLRSKYVRAVRTAFDSIGSGLQRRGDRVELLRILVEERFLIPSEELRRPMRQIALETNSGSSRVAQCGQRLAGAIRNVLDADPEFDELRRRARAHPDGFAGVIDGDIERGLIEAGATELVKRYRRAEGGGDARLLHAVMTGSRADIEGTIRDRFAACPTSTRRRMLEETYKPDGAKGRADPNERPGRGSASPRRGRNKTAQGNALGMKANENIKP